MPSNPYPVLGPEGFIYDAVQKIEAIFADYIAAKNSQSTIFYGQIQSLSYDEFDGQYDAVLSAEIIKRSLDALYGAYFDNVDIQCVDNSEEDTTTTLVKISGTLIDRGKQYRINEALNMNHGKIQRLASFN